MVHDDILHDLYDSYPTNFIGQNQLEPSLDEIAGYDHFLKKNDSKPCYYQNGSFYAPTYLGTTNSIHDRQTSRPLSHMAKVWSSHSDDLSSPDSPAEYLSYIEEPWSPASATTEPDDDTSLASSIASLSPNSDLDSLGEPTEDEDDDNFYSSPAVSPREDPLYHPLEQYPLHERSAYHDDDDLSPLTFSPPSLSPLHFLSLSESRHQSTIKKSSTHSPPIQPPPLYNCHSFFDYDSSAPVPCSPSRRRSATLPELEATTFDADLFGLHKSIPETLPLRDIGMDAPDIRWCSFPGYETDDTLIPVELASKNYIPDPSVVVPTTSTGKSSLLLWDHDYNDRSDIPPPRSPSPENFYLDPTLLAECGDEELRKVYELRQRTAKSEKWERERCRELSALLRLKLDERGVLGGGEGGDCSNHQSDSRSLSCYTGLPFSSSPSSDSLTVYQPQPGIPSSSSPISPPVSSSTQNPVLVPSSSPRSTLPSTSGKPHAQSEGSKHKIRSMAQLVASMLFHRQSDTLRRHPSRKAGVEHTSSSHSSHCFAPPSTVGGTGMKVLSTPRSRLSTVMLPEELDVDSEEGQGVGVEAEIGDEAEEEAKAMDVDDRSSSRSCLDMDLDEGGTYGKSSSHTVTWAAPSCTLTSTR